MAGGSGGIDSLARANAFSCACYGDLFFRRSILTLGRSPPQVGALGAYPHTATLFRPSLTGRALTSVRLRCLFPHDINDCYGSGGSRFRDISWKSKPALHTSVDHRCFEMIVRSPLSPTNLHTQHTLWPTHSLTHSLTFEGCRFEGLPKEV